VPGYFGDYVLTNLGLASFITAFEGMIRNHPGKTILNCTEGGAKINGAKQKSLHSMLKDCKKITKPTLSTGYIDNANELIKEAIESLKKDIENLDTIIKKCSDGIRAAESLKETNDKKIIKKLLAENEILSQEAHTAVKKNSLMGLAIYDVNRKIYSKELKVKGTIRHLLKNSDDLKTRVKRNILILAAAKEAANKLKPLYDKSLLTLEKYIKTKNESILINAEPEKIDLSDMKKYFDVNNWAFPILESKKALEENEFSEKALDIYIKAVAQRDLAIEKAKKEYDHKTTDNLIKYIELVEEGQRLGREEQKFEEAFEKLKEANKLMPEKPTALWGLATTYHRINKIDESIKCYKRLIKEFPENLTFMFEYGIAMLEEDVNEGIQIITDAMKKSDQFDSFFIHIATLYKNMEKYDKALDAIGEYIKKFPADYRAWELKAEIHKSMNDIKKYDACLKKIASLMPAI
jgi:tetratricopeptide (TPR) repeat protein